MVTTDNAVFVWYPVFFISQLESIFEVIQNFNEEKHGKTSLNQV